jgi:FixJ family two-component response regulator
MARLLLIDDDRDSIDSCAAMCERLGFDVEVAKSGLSGLRLALHDQYDVIVADEHLPDVPALDLLTSLRNAHVHSPFIVTTRTGTIQAAVRAMRNGALDYLETPLSPDHLLEVAERASALYRRTAPTRPPVARVERHATVRWATRLVVPVIDSPRDLKTLAAWGRYLAVSKGAVKNWCRTAGLGPRRSLLLARMLRALIIHHTHGVPPQDSLDVVDRRTLTNILRLGGLAGELFPQTVDSFLEQQILISDPAAIEELRLVLQCRPGHSVGTRAAS